MQRLVGIVRNEAEMKEALGRVRDLKERADRLGAEGHREYHSGWHTSIDVGNLLAVSEAITVSAIERKESRGGHFREDYPEKVAEYGTFNIVVKQGRDGSMQVSRVPIPPMPDHLKQAIEEQKS
jgi:succinate dehydrogenase / fumarate reductase flavoprotein subunit